MASTLLIYFHIQVISSYLYNYVTYYSENKIFVKHSSVSYNIINFNNLLAQLQGMAKIH